jgi:hypothetical protein
MNVPINSDTIAAIAADPILPERLFVVGASTGADSTTLTVVNFVDCFEESAFLVELLAVEAAFLVAMHFPPLVKYKAIVA